MRRRTTRAALANHRASAISLWRVAVGVSLCVWWGAGTAGAQPVRDLLLSEEEVTAWQLTQVERYIAARESAEEVLRGRPRSIVAYAVLGLVHRYGEGNLPRSLYYLRRARRLLEDRFGSRPVGPVAQEWHRRILEETAFSAGEMERFEEELDLWALHDRLYEPAMPGERIWPLLMLRRLPEARRWADRALRSNDTWSQRQALNGLCAIENEAGNRLESYRWCRQHAEDIWGQPGYGGVYLCNAGEAARGLFRFDEAERYYLEATRREVEWYANPWMFLADLYLRAGRLALAAQAVRSMHDYARRRPPHTQQQDQSERYRTVAALLLVAGRPEQALPLTERAVLSPDRRGGQSRTPEADLVTNALMARRALLDAAEVTLERGSWGTLWERAKAWGRALWLRARAFRAGRRAVALLADPALLAGLLEAEGPLSFGTPPWLAAELVQVTGPGPVLASLARVRRRAPSEVPELRAYLDASAAEARAAQGNWEAARAFALRAERGLPPGEALLRARVQLVTARAREQQGQWESAVAQEVELLQLDPVLFRRTRQSLPVRIATDGQALSRQTERLVRRSPRLRRVEASPLLLRLRSEGPRHCQICFTMEDGQEVACASRSDLPGQSLFERAQACAALVPDELMAPRVDMSLFDPTSLDGLTSGGSINEMLRGTAPPAWPMDE